jgi:diadenylate cyclase
MNIASFFQSWAGNIIAIFADFRFVDFLDICLVTFLIYSAIKLIRETRTMQLIKGILLLGIVYVVVSVLDMGMSKYLFNALFRDVILVLIVVFQPEIRHVFETMGRSRFKSIVGIHTRTTELRYNEETNHVIDEICRACAEMSDRKIGVLLVMERETMLGEVIQTGTPVEAKVSEELLGNIFFPKAPLHDGAAVIRNNRLCAAGCILPLTQDHNMVSSELGTRHRAAIGMSEQSDAVVVVVSEETGNISVAKDGKLERNISVGDLRELLCKEMLIAEADDNKINLRNLFGRKQK